MLKTRGAGKPRWLAKKPPVGAGYEKVRSLIAGGGLSSVCQEARCPNRFECFSKQTATFLILGSVCVRNCVFCAVKSGSPDPPDPDEPRRVAGAAKALRLKYIVVTSVTRDDLPDGGSEIFAQTVREIRRTIPGAETEVLIPDFQGSAEALQTVLEAGPRVLNHNIETVPRLYAKVRPEADYRRSLELLRRAGKARPDIPTKSGIMLGLGERDEEVERTLEDLRENGCSMLTMGQYLQPSRRLLPVERFVSPEEFDKWRERALKAGFEGVAAGPLVRSSYQAEKLLRADKKGGRAEYPDL